MNHLVKTYKTLGSFWDEACSAFSLLAIAPTGAASKSRAVASRPRVGKTDERSVPEAGDVEGRLVSLFFSDKKKHLMKSTPRRKNKQKKHVSFFCSFFFWVVISFHYVFCF